MWDNCCGAQFLSTLEEVNLVELVELDVAIGCKKNVCSDRFQLRIEEI